MKWILYAISLLWIASGAGAILYTAQWRNLMKVLFEKTSCRIWGGVETGGGFLLLLAASASRIPWAVAALGIVAMAEGVLFLLNPGDAARKLTTWYVEALSDQAHRLIGIIALVLGTAVLSWIR